jgi:hypothetical protein
MDINYTDYEYIPTTETSETLLSFIEKYKHLPEQLSDEWKKQRKYTIGGSEIGIIEGTNVYSNISKLKNIKTGKTVFEGNVWTKLGNLLEDVVVGFLEKKFDCKIHCTGSIPGLLNKDQEPIQTYSPDGLATVNATNFNLKKDDFILPQKDVYNVLFEIKVPGKRIPTGEWTKSIMMYRSQVLAGLCTIDLCDFGIFADAIIRLCTQEQFLYNNECYYYPQQEQFNISDNYEYPIMVGAIIFRSDEEVNCVIDYNDLDVVFDKKYTKKYLFIDHDFNKKCVQLVKDISNDRNVARVFYWKLFDVKFIPINKQKYYLENMRPFIEQFFNSLNEYQPQQQLSGWNREIVDFLK